MKVKYRYLIAGLIILILVVYEILQVTRGITYESIIGSFPLLIASFFAVLIFVIIGATFFGMFLAHRIISIREFTPFEIEMLKMRKDISDMKRKLEEMEKRGGRE